MRTSIAPSLASRGCALLLAPVVDRAVGDVAQRDVDDEHERRERDAGRHLLLEEDRDQDGEQRRSDAGPLRRAFPGRRAVHALLTPPARLDARLLLGHRATLRRRRGRAAAVVSRTLDDAGGVPAVLALALGLSHQDDCEGSSASSIVRGLRIGIAAGKSASAAAGASPTSSASLTGAGSAIRLMISGIGAAR